MINIEYLIQNNEKGYFGAFSKAGKDSARLYGNIRQKDRLLNPEKYRKDNRAVVDFLKRNGYHNIYGDNQIVKIIKNEELDDSQIEEVEEEIDIFKMEDKKPEEEIKKEKPKIKKNEIKKYFHRTDSNAYKFHDLHRQRGTKYTPFKTPTCTKYNPDKNVVMKRTLDGPKWERQSGRLPLFGIDNTKYYLNHENPLKNIGNNFIDMDKQTMRGPNLTYHDLRIITTKPFVPKNKKKKVKKEKDEEEEEEEKNESIIESEYSQFNKTNPNINLKNDNNISNLKGKKKRVQSAVTSSTRPQTAHPKNVTTLTSNNSRQINTSNSKNITSTSKNLNINNITGDNNYLSEEDDIEIYSVSSSELNDSYNQFKNVYQRQIKPKNNQNKSQNEKKGISHKSSRNSSAKIKKSERLSKKQVKDMKINKAKKRPKSSHINRKLNINKNNKIPKSKIKGPDFDKAISREYYENLSDHGTTLIPFSLPNFKLVRERPLTMVVYERPLYTKKKSAELIGITPDMYNDIYKYLESTNNHTRCVPPNFEKMNARPPTDNSPLPVYMKGAVSRGACEMVTEASLKMNNFAEGKYISGYTSFWPKKSYNKIINLNLLNSDAFLSNLMNNKSDVETANNYVAKSMKFYRKNYEDLLKEGLLNKFDNVTYKTIKPGVKTEFKKMEKFLEKYGK